MSKQTNAVLLVADISGYTKFMKMHEISLNHAKQIVVMNNMDVCTCPACLETGDLKLKQVVHTGEIELEKINKSDKLFGVDVIVVHRMLKNSVPSNEFVMMTNHAYSDFVDFYGLKPSPFRENFEGIGEVDTQVFYLEDLNLPEISAPEMRKPSFLQRTFWKMNLVPNTLLELSGIKKIKGNFNNLPA